MAWFRRKRDDAPDVEETAPAEADAGDVVRASRSQAGDWMAMPPIHTTVGPPPSTFKVQRVSEIMTTRRPMAFMGQLGHQVSSSAPSGHVEGLATTVGPPTAASHPIDLPLHGRAPHHEEPELPAPAITSTPSPTADEPAVQRSVRDLAPEEPVTAQTLGVSRQAMPTVQRALSVSPPAAAGASTPSRPALPEPSPSRVLREPARPASPLESRVPSLPVVGALSTPPRPEPEEFVVPDRAVEFTVESSGPPEVTASPAAPLAGSLPLQRRAEPDAADAVSPALRDPAAPDLPLAAPPTTTSTPAPPAISGELMPPIQPRAVQRRATEAAAAPKPAPAPEPPAPTVDDLPPLPAWARESIGLPPAGNDAGEAPAADMPLLAPAARATDAPGTPAHAGDAGDIDSPGAPDAPHGELAPLAGAASELGTPPPVRRSEAAAGEGASPAGLDLTLHTPTAPSPAGTPVQREADRVAMTAIGSPLDVQRSAEDPGHGQPGHVHSDDAEPSLDEEPSSVAPLLGDRPLQLQRLSAEPGVTSFEPPAGPSALPLPLVADVAGGPALQPQRDPAAPSAPPASSGPGAPNAPGGPHASTAATGATMPSAPVARALAVPLQRSAATPAPAAAGPTGPTGLPLRSLTPAHASASAGSAAGAGVTGGTRGETTSTAPQPLPLVAVQTQREATAPMPLQEPARPSAAAAAATATVLREAIQNGSGFYDADGNVVLSGPGADAGAPAGATSGGTAVQRSAATVNDLVVQRAETSADGGSTTGVSPSADGDDKQLDEMAAKVYDRIRWKLVSDMRADERRLGAGHWNRKGR